MTKLSSREFCRLLSSRTAVPGSGSAAALTGALAVSLCAMAAGSSMDTRAWGREGELRQLLLRCQLLQEQLLDLVEEDASAREVLGWADSVPGCDTDGIREKAHLQVCRPQVKIMELCGTVLELLAELETRCGTGLKCQAACAAALCCAAMECAQINISACEAALPESGAVKELHKKAAAALQAGRERAAGLHTETKTEMTREETRL